MPFRVSNSHIACAAVKVQGLGRKWVKAVGSPGSEWSETEWIKPPRQANTIGALIVIVFWGFLIVIIV